MHNFAEEKEIDRWKMKTNLLHYLKFCCFIATFWGGTMIGMAQLKTVTETVFDRAANEENFAFGADISWLSQQESWGTYYCNRAGKRADLMDILQKDYGLNAVRFRVWVNPSGGWSGKQDVVNLCKRAHARGLKIMISFHYSDTWADSGSQTIPAKWTDHSAEALAKNVHDHTYDVLKALVDLGIHPVWVGIGNETKYGMLYETGRTKTTEGMKNFVKFINSAYQAIQEVDPNIKSFIHLSNAHDEATARNMFDNLNKYGAHYDMIGLSAYPRWSHLDLDTDANIQKAVNTYLTVFKNLKKRFGKPIVVAETGHYVDRPMEANRFLAEFMKALIADGEIGCFYWEPEASSGYNLGAWDGATHQATIAMDAYLGVKHTEVTKYGTTLLSLPADTAIYPIGEPVEMKLYAQTSTKVTKVETVDFYLNGEKVASKPREGSGNYYSFVTDTLPAGPHTFFARVNDNQGHTVDSDTISFFVGDMTILQENENGYLGISDAEQQIGSKVKKYTGEGYVPTSTSVSTTVSWAVLFPEAGDYTLTLRYHTDLTKSVMLYIDEQSKVMKCPQSPEGRWTYASKQVTVAEPGVRTVKVKGLTSKGYPDIDFLGITSPEGVSPVIAADGVSSIHVIPADDISGKDQNVYDISGRVVSKGGKLMGLRAGIYILNGKKKVLK